MFLTADIGGTKSILAVATWQDRRIVLSSIKLYLSHQYASLESVIDTYLAEFPEVLPTSLCAAVAGPVMDNRCSLTNINMEIDAESLKRRESIERVVLINDLTAAGYGLEVLPDSGLETIHNGDGAKSGNRVLVSPGTGLGESIIHDMADRFVPLPSEGGHADFAPFDGMTFRLWSFMRRNLSRVSIESVLSGPGIYNIYRFLVSENGQEIDDELKPGRTDAPGPLIARRAIEKAEPLALETISLFFDILAAESGNMALNAMASGGIYLGGGIVPYLLPLMDRKRFATVLADKGVHQRLLEKFPIQVVTDTRLPLYGAANYIMFSDRS
jgi:glucokinase